MNLPDERTILLTLTTAIAGGLLLTVTARHLKIPAIVLLLAGGIALGPQGLGWVQPASLDGFLPVIVSLAVGLILFEGGLTLDLRGYARGSTVIAGLLTIGIVVPGWARPWRHGWCLGSIGPWRCWPAAWSSLPARP
jgi:NhaP-type Na+/H+ or K+/H+ antiporter